MRNLSLIAALIAATLPTAAMAADWVLVNAAPAGNKIFYIDQDSIRTMPNGNKRAWERGNWSEPDQEGDTGYLALSEYDCREGRKRELQSTWFKREAITGNYNIISEWSYVVAPETIGESLLNYVCFGKLD